METKEVSAVTLLPIDRSRTPEIYRTSNSQYFGRWCVDFYPEEIPTFASFDTAQAAVDWLTKQFGRQQVAAWLATKPVAISGDAVLV